MCLRPHGQSENFYGDRNQFKVIYNNNNNNNNNFIYSGRVKASAGNRKRFSDE